MSFTKKFYLSDTHFCHTNILSMQPRPFSTISESGGAKLVHGSGGIVPPRAA